MTHDCKVIKLEGCPVKKPWGGVRLQELSKNHDGDPIGEVWQISIHPDAPSKLNGTCLKGKLSEDQMPYLVKLIDTSDNLSVQVHPDDAFANKHESSLGKSECWVILEADDDSGVYLGLHPNVSKTDFEQAVVTNSNVNDYLVFRKVSVGDFFFVPAGAIHAIGRGILLAEVQQSSGITYRVWDWNRRDAGGQGRELHIDKAMQVINFSQEFNSDTSFNTKSGLFTKNGVTKLVRHHNFNLDLYSTKGGRTINIKLADNTRVNSIMILRGKAKVDSQDIDIGQYEAYLLEGEELNITPQGDFSLLHVY